MLILVIMMLGVIIGMKLNLKKTLKVNGVLQIVLTGILIFIMGVSLGSRENARPRNNRARCPRGNG